MKMHNRGQVAVVFAVLFWAIIVFGLIFIWLRQNEHIATLERLSVHNNSEASSILGETPYLIGFGFSSFWENCMLYVFSVPAATELQSELNTSERFGKVVGRQIYRLPYKCPAPEEQERLAQVYQFTQINWEAVIDAWLPFMQRPEFFAPAAVENLPPDR